MKTAILLAVSADGRTGRPLTEVLPYDEAKKKFRELSNATESPDPAFPVIEIWTGCEKSKKFRGAAPTPAEAVAILTAPVEAAPVDDLDPQTKETLDLKPAPSPGSLTPAKRGKGN